MTDENLCENCGHEKLEHSSKYKVRFHKCNVKGCQCKKFKPKSNHSQEKSDASVETKNLSSPDTLRGSNALNEKIEEQFGRKLRDEFIEDLKGYPKETKFILEPVDAVTEFVNEEAKKLMNEKLKETYYSVENKWFKECQRIDNELTNKINELKKQNKNLRDKVSRFESGLTPNEKYKYKKLKEEMKLTNEAYNDVCDERDNLRKKAEEFNNKVKKLKEEILCKNCNMCPENNCHICNQYKRAINKIFGGLKND